MARRIVEEGWPLTIWARREASLAPFADTPALVAASLRELGERSDVVGVCVVTDADVEGVVLGDNILAGMQPGGILVIHSTVLPSTCHAIAEVAVGHGVTVLDAPVSGSGPAAVEKRLAVMVGGEREAFERCRPVFESYAGALELLGPLGSGQLCKLVNNVLFAANVGLALEAFALGDAFGLDRGALVEMVMASSGSSWAVRSLHPRADPERIQHGVRMMRKDVGLVAALARSTGLERTAIEDIAEFGLDRLTNETLGSG
jgi:3-hydroxyisobutyrate dehydrogenase-like beta-hydroxyacid dehydrogenase